MLCGMSHKGSWPVFFFSGSLSPASVSPYKLTHVSAQWGHTVAHTIDTHSEHLINAVLKSSFWEEKVLPHCIVCLSVETNVWFCVVQIRCVHNLEHIKSKYWFLAQQDIGINPKQLCFVSITLATSDTGRHLALEFISLEAQKHVKHGLFSVANGLANTK